ncbi:MAG TPA: penicillin acylase family protein, partial [Candidatus Kapabacteria bacterium]|nr:penicillin acylase family protein [Candidatus Kapabacteria bacterium]
LPDLVMRRRFSLLAIPLMVLALSGCDAMDLMLRNTVDKAEGVVQLKGVSAPVTIRRDAFGVPLVEAASEDDLAFGLGYVMASDRLAQMVSYSLVAQGRLSEMAGATTRDLDIYMRTLGLHRHAEQHLKLASPALRHKLQRFADGVNAWMASHQDRLPLDFKLSAYAPEAWTPLHSMDVFMMLNLGLSLNLPEEVAFLDLARVVGPEKAAWLIPSYPDEPVALDEAAKLGDFPFKDLQTNVVAQSRVSQQLASLFVPVRQAASNNWAVAAARTKGKASILANDTHLMLEHPPVWMLVQVSAPGYRAGGIAIAGLPGVVAGYNGHVAWGMTMVMADSQDVFVEKLKQENGKTFYLYRGEWQPVTERREVIRIKGEPDHVVTVQETVHGPLLNDALRGRRVNEVMLPTQRVSGGYGLAVQTTAGVADLSMERFFRLGQAADFAAVGEAIQGIGAIHLNLLFADAANIGWQVTGLYPQRRKGRGYFPSPGWTGEYDWAGMVPFAQLPRDINPATGFLATANHRTVMANHVPHLTGSWYAPERHERIVQQLEADAGQTLSSTVALQGDVVDLAALKLRDLLQAHDQRLRERIAHMPEGARESALKSLGMLTAFDGRMAIDAPGAALYGIFLDSLTRQVFADELGAPEGQAWQSFLSANAITYSAQQDHMLGREDSPFWDDVKTAERREGKWDIVARTLAISWQQALFQLSADPANWRWGKLHTYHWESGSTKMKPFMPAVPGMVVGLLGRYLDRGPFPAPGSTNTVNVAGYTIGDGYKVWNVPAMRLVVDFSLSEPLQVIIAGGQSGNPASRHYDDGIPLYLSGDNRRMAFHDAGLVSEQFNRTLVLKPATVSEQPK